MDLSKNLYKIKEKIRRRQERTPEQIIEHSLKKMESDRKKREKELNELLKTKYNLKIDEE